MSKFLKTLIFGITLTAMMFSGLTAQAFTLINGSDTQLTLKASAEPSAFDPSLGQNTVIKYCLNAQANVSIGIYQPSSTSSQKVAILASNKPQSAGCSSATWDGKSDANSEIGTSGELVENGQYFYYIEANKDGQTVTASDWITVGEGPNLGAAKFIDVNVDNPIFDPWDSQKATINFSISKGGYITLQINDSDNLKVVKIIDSKWYEKGEYSAYWNGEDDVGNKVAQDEYSYSIKVAKGEEVSKKTGKIVVKKGYNSQTTQTEDPRIENNYVTKEEFDPGRKEKEYIVFNLTAKSNLQVSIYDKEENFVKKLYNKPDQAAGAYTILWDGQEALNKDATYTYRIYAQNAKGEDTKKGKILVAEDRSDTSRANIFKDYVDSITFNPKDGEEAINFTLEKDAKVTVEIRDSKHLITTIGTKETPYSEGTQTVYWDGKNKYGNFADEGQYMYRITAKNNAGKEVEEGSFTLKKSNSEKSSDPDCSQFKDVTSFNPYCKAIQWAASEKIFQGYNDGTFRPDQTINRAEALKVVLKALKIQLIPANGESLGFNDTYVQEWYATYIKTGVSLGVIHGYKDGSFKPNQLVTHSEAQIMLFRAANSKGLYYPETNDYYPNAKMSRGEMADLLYRQYQNM